MSQLTPIQTGAQLATRDWGLKDVAQLAGFVALGLIFLACLALYIYRDDDL